jgi:hypothetical protein
MLQQHLLLQLLLLLPLVAATALLLQLRVQEHLQLLLHGSTSCFELYNNMTTTCVSLLPPTDIQQGQGMEFDIGSTPEFPIFKAVTCNSNNYGTADTLYGLEELPCEGCLQGMVTADLYRNVETGAQQCLPSSGFQASGVSPVIALMFLQAEHGWLAVQLTCSSSLTSTAAWARMCNTAHCMSEMVVNVAVQQGLAPHMCEMCDSWASSVIMRL